MTEDTRMILERLDAMGQDLKETKIIASEARDEAREAKVIAMEARDEAREAKVIAMEARDEAREAKAIAMEARDAANEAKEIAMEARDEAREAKKIAMEARDAANGAKEISKEALFTAIDAKKSIEDLHKKVADIQATIDYELCRKINAIGDGHDLLTRKLDAALKMEHERERMWLEILNLRQDMKIVKNKLCVA